MVVGFVLAVGASVLSIARETMSPTVVEFDAVAREFGGAFGTAVGIAFVGICGWRKMFGTDGGGVVGAMKTCGACSQFAVPFFFMLGEVKHEIGPGVVNLVFVVPCGNGMVVDTCFLERFQGKFDGGAVVDVAASCGGNAANIADALPKVFEGLIGVPLLGELGAIGLKVGGRKLAIGGSQMGEQRWNGDISVSKHVIFKALVVDWFDCGQNLLLERLVCLLVRGIIVRFLIVQAVGCSDLGLGGVDSVGCLDSRMHRSDEGFACSDEIRCRGHYNAKMSIHAPSALGVDGAGIGECLFLELFDGSGGRLVGDGR